MKTHRASFFARAAALAVTVAAAAATSHAAIVYVDPPDVAVPATLTGGYIDFVTGQVATSSFAGYDLNPYRQSTAAGLAFFMPSGSGVVADGANQPAALTEGAAIGSGSTFLTGAQPAPAFRTDGTEILGVRFVNTTTGVTNYGWAEFTTSTTGAPGFPAKLTRYAYEDSGASILAGQTAAVPEPGTVAALAMGAAGLGGAAWRRRQATV